jgi:hypothetical protein
MDNPETVICGLKPIFLAVEPHLLQYYYFVCDHKSNCSSASYNLCLFIMMCSFTIAIHHTCIYNQFGGTKFHWIHIEYLFTLYQSHHFFVFYSFQ